MKKKEKKNQELGSVNDYGFDVTLVCASCELRLDLCQLLYRAYFILC